MLKFIGKNKKLKFVLFDNDTEPREIEKLSPEVLRDLNIILHEDKENKKKKPSGISQNDIRYLKGD